MLRVRFAPSPTGFLHVGGLRTYLYNWLLAKKEKGKIVLRIEDTDRERYVEGATENLIKILKNMGLPWDEGPYFQSQRTEIYKSMVQKLVEGDHAYYCFCSPEELKKLRQEQVERKLPPRYNKGCSKLTKKEIEEKFKQKQPYVIRLKVPEKGRVKFQDLVHGQIEFDLKNIDDQILLKSNGWPTYHLANVIDDHLMEINHVIRGEEWLSSTPKHILIYQAFGWPIPKFTHLPLLLNSDHSKLSKRQGDVSVEDYLAQGYLPETLINFLVLLGWNPDNNQEIFNLKQLKKIFSLEKIQKTGAIFNRKKLDWLNGFYIRQMKIEDLTKQCLPYLERYGSLEPCDTKNSKFKILKNGQIVKFSWVKKIIALEQERLKNLGEIGELTEFFFTDNLSYNSNLLFWKKMTIGQVKDNLEQIRDAFHQVQDSKFKFKKITEILTRLGKEKGIGEIFWPLRVVLSGRKASPPPVEIAEILGKKTVLNRINQIIEKLNK